MNNTAKTNDTLKRTRRGWEALEIRLKERDLSDIELKEARKSFYAGIEVLSKMFLVCEHNVHELRTGLDSSLRSE